MPAADWLQDGRCASNERFRATEVRCGVPPDQEDGGRHGRFVEPNRDDAAWLKVNKLERLDATSEEKLPRLNWPPDAHRVPLAGGRFAPKEKAEGARDDMVRWLSAPRAKPLGESMRLLGDQYDPAQRPPFGFENVR